MSELVKYSEQTFESIKHINEYGDESGQHEENGR